jgi:hypothetical protein
VKNNFDANSRKRASRSASFSCMVVGKGRAK